MVVLSISPNFFLCFLANSPRNFCRVKPRIKGKIICRNNFKSTSKNSKLALRLRKKLNQIGVTKIPIIPERLALKIAVGKLPLARETITIEDETVEGRVPRKNRAIQRFEAVPFSKSGRHKSVSNGNTTNVVN